MGPTSGPGDGGNDGRSCRLCRAECGTWHSGTCAVVSAVGRRRAALPGHRMETRSAAGGVRDVFRRKAPDHGMLLFTVCTDTRTCVLFYPRLEHLSRGGTKYYRCAG